MLENSTTKIALVASRGGHWVQLRLVEQLIPGTVIKISTHGNTEADYTLVNFSRSDAYLSFAAACQSFKILRQTKPDWVVSTGAAPGLLFLFIAKLLGIKTLWLDSMANTQKISVSGKIASYFCSICLTQWEPLATKKVQYQGRLL